MTESGETLSSMVNLLFSNFFGLAEACLNLHRAFSVSVSLLYIFGFTGDFSGLEQVPWVDGRDEKLKMLNFGVSETV